VAPLLRSGARSRTLYLPEGSWRHYWTGRRYQGRRWITVAAPETEIPLFIARGLDLRLPAPAALWRRMPPQWAIPPPRAGNRRSAVPHAG
jgi:alpha-glucosidase (family GH31 glycosyl hydrolase)